MAEMRITTEELARALYIAEAPNEDEAQRGAAWDGYGPTVRKRIVCWGVAERLLRLTAPAPTVNGPKADGMEARVREMLARWSAKNPTNRFARTVARDAVRDLEAILSAVDGPKVETRGVPAKSYSVHLAPSGTTAEEGAKVETGDPVTLLREMGSVLTHYAAECLNSGRTRSSADLSSLEHRRTAVLAAVDGTPDAPENMGMGTPWPLSDVLERLVEAANHLMYEHSCDSHGYETLIAARDAAHGYVAQLRSGIPDAGREPEDAQEARTLIEEASRQVDNIRMHCYQPQKLHCSGCVGSVGSVAELLAAALRRLPRAAPAAVESTPE